MCRIEHPHIIISDKGTNFACDRTRILHSFHYTPTFIV